MGRTFGAGDDQIELVMEKFSPAQELDVTVVGKVLRPGSGLIVPYTAGFGSDAATYKKAEAMNGTLGKEKTPVLALGTFHILWPKRPVLEAGAPDADAVAKIRHFSLTINSRTFDLHFGPLKGVMAEMDKCTANLMTGWGLNPLQQASLISPPIPVTSPAGWLRSGDYPAGALRSGVSSMVFFRLMVDADGSPASCHVQRGTMDASFQKLTCDLLMKRARFHPARDEKGGPVPSYYVESVRWLNRR
ncbi:energy transducer TonB [Novosphingobium sp. SL115]|uniref:energy transducer TonB n=1 Tax=Novosphingobium sp. SL115 TaxID=2995150 RepID=UPI002276FC80|nr:energy transducer TonB [Novosphingobium sp. SL115]MCY1670753.1 energy transducer TonB [Novosphingobium sp. SL115]